MNKKAIFVTVLTAIIILFSGIMFFNRASLHMGVRVNAFHNNKPHTTFDNRFTPYIGPIEGELLSVSKLKKDRSYGKEIPFIVKLPKKLGYPLFAKLNPNNKHLLVVYCNKNLSPNLSFEQMINKGAIVITEFKYPLSKQQANEMFDEAVKSIRKDGGVLYKTEINGHPAVYGGNIEHGVTWDDGNVWLDISANPNVPYQTLIEIAKDMTD